MHTLVTATTDTTSTTDVIMGVLLLLFMFVAYFIPTVIALLRKHNPLGTFIVNFLTGWTMIGWVIALVMACGSGDRVVVIHNTPTH
jgi:hypothetical protein